MPIRSPSGRCRQRASFSSTARWTAGSYICPGTARSIRSARLYSIVASPFSGKSSHTRPSVWALAAQVQPYPEPAGALLHRVRRGALQVKPEIKRRARAPRPLDLLGAELLARHALAVDFGHYLTQRPDFVCFGVDLLAQHSKAPASHAEHLIQTTY